MYKVKILWDHREQQTYKRNGNRNLPGEKAGGTTTAGKENNTTKAWMQKTQLGNQKSWGARAGRLSRKDAWAWNGSN